MFALFQLFGYSNKVNGQVFDNLPKNRSVLPVVKSIVEAGVSPEARKRSRQPGAGRTMGRTMVGHGGDGVAGSVAAAGGRSAADGAHGECMQRERCELVLCHR